MPGIQAGHQQTSLLRKFPELGKMIIQHIQSCINRRKPRPTFNRPWGFPRRTRLIAFLGLLNMLRRLLNAAPETPEMPGTDNVKVIIRR